MQTSIVRLIAQSLVLVLVMTIGVFALLAQAPGGLIGVYLSPDAPVVGAKTIAREMGPFSSIPAQYVAWLGHVLRGDLGWSQSSSEPVAQVLVEHLLPTIELVAPALLIVIVLGILGEALRARANGTWLGTVFTMSELIARAIPVAPFAALTVLVLMLSGIPSVGIASNDTFDLIDRLRHLAGPLLTLALPIGAWASCAFFEAGRARDDAGVRRGRDRIVDLVRTAAVCVSVLGPVVVAGSFFVEPAFAWPGIMRVLGPAIAQKDTGLIAGLGIVYALASIALTLAAQLVLGFVREATPSGSAMSGDRAPRRRFFSNPIAVAGLVLFGSFAALGAGASLFPLDPYRIDAVHWQGYPLAPGVGGHLLGTDENGRDLLACLLFGLRTSLAVAVGATLIATPIGLAIAATARAFSHGSRPMAEAVGGRATADGAGVRALAGIRAFGTLPLVMIAAVLVLSHAMTPLLEMLVIAVVSWPAIAAAARSSSSPRTIGGAVVGVAGSALLLDLTLSYRGYAVPEPAPALGNALMNMQSIITVAPWIVAAPLVLIVTLLFALYAISDGLREA